MTEPRDLALPTGYTDLLSELKNRVRAARTKVLRTVNTQLIEVLVRRPDHPGRQASDGWGDRGHRPAGGGPGSRVP
jgi:hypothetical protein